MLMLNPLCKCKDVSSFFPHKVQTDGVSVRGFFTARQSAAVRMWEMFLVCLLLAAAASDADDNAVVSLEHRQGWAHTGERRGALTEL